jgi:hypothetical protein
MGDYWDGMLPAGTKCKRCGKVLNADGGHPAELYAGTYTGECYSCARENGRVERGYPTGARELSYLDDYQPLRRSQFTAYADCEVCQGQGYIHISRALAFGGSYKSYCQPCLDRHLAAKQEMARQQPGPTKIIVLDITAGDDIPIDQGVHFPVSVRMLHEYNLYRELGTYEVELAPWELAAQIEADSKSIAQYVPKGYEYWRYQQFPHATEFAWAEEVLYLGVFKKERLKAWKQWKREKKAADKLAKAG